MKDFQEVIDSNREVEPTVEIEKKEPVWVYRKYIEQMLPFVSPFLLSVVTGPLNTASMLMQMTSKGSPSYLAKVKAQPHLERHIKNGIFGDNKIYEPPKLDGYREVFKKMGREGVRGLYKGNLTGVVLASSNAGMKSELYRRLGETGTLG